MIDTEKLKNCLRFGTLGYLGKRAEWYFKPYTKYLKIFEGKRFIKGMDGEKLINEVFNIVST